MLPIFIFLLFELFQTVVCCDESINSHENFRLLSDLDRSKQCGRGYFVPHENPARSRIMGGYDTDLAEFPWIVFIKTKYPRINMFSYCGGSLINERYVITAGHCVQEHEGGGTPRIEVSLGEWKLNNSVDWFGDFVNLTVVPEEARDCQGKRCAPDPLVIAVEEVKIHDNYSMSPKKDETHNDISLLRLFKSVVFNDYVKPICLPLTCKLQDEDLVGRLLTISGWGVTKAVPPRPMANTLQKLSLRVVNQQDCLNIWKGDGKRIEDTQICAGDVRGQSACPGDSGGPLMVPEVNKDSLVTYYLMGVISYSIVCKDRPDLPKTPMPPDVFARVVSYLPWILDNIRP